MLQQGEFTKDLIMARATNTRTIMIMSNWELSTVTMTILQRWVRRHLLGVTARPVLIFRMIRNNGAGRLKRTPAAVPRFMSAIWVRAEKYLLMFSGRIKLFLDT